MLRTTLVSLMLFAPAVAFGATWNVDTSHSSARFSVRHMMVSNVHGKLGDIKGTFSFNEKDVTRSSVDVSIDVGAIDTGDAKRDAHLKAPDFFDVAKFPAITFKSKRVKRAGKNSIKIIGDLTMHGVTKEVTLESEGPTAVINDPYGMRRVGFSASTSLKRKDFGVSWSKTMDNGGLVVGDAVNISIDIEFVTK